jgi:hypothetical protein
MPITAADVAQVIAMEAPNNGGDDYELRALETSASVLAFFVASARADGEDEADLIELIIRSAEMPPDEVRRDAGLLHALGYTEVAAMMRRIAGRRTKTLVPLP